MFHIVPISSMLVKGKIMEKTEVTANQLPELAAQSRLLSITQVRDLLGVGRTTLWRWMKLPDPPPSVILSGTKRKTRKFPYDKLMWWVENHQE